MGEISQATLPLLVPSDLAVGGVNSAVTGASQASRIPPTSNSKGGLESRSSLTLQALLAAGGAASADIPSLPLIQASGTALNGVVTVVSPAALEIGFIRGSGRTAAVVGSQATLPGFTAVSQALNGELGTSSVSRGLLTASSTGGPNAVGTSVQTLLGLLARGIATIPAGASYSAIVLNTQTQAAWTYSSFPFNSFCLFNGVVLAAGDSGLFTLDGASDNGAPIQAYIRLGITDFSTSFRNRVERVYMGYRAQNDLILRVRTDGITVRDYRIPSNLKAGIHGAHVKLGRGLEARYWQFEVRNAADGGDFSLDMLECKPIKLARRVGGADA